MTAVYISSLKRIGAVVAKEDIRANKHTLVIRIGSDSDSRGKWARFVSELLHVEQRGKVRHWKVDVGQTYFLDNGAVRYLWRLIFTAAKSDKTAKIMKDIEVVISQTALSALASSVEITEMPLIGRADYAARGKKTMGAVESTSDATAPLRKALQAT